MDRYKSKCCNVEQLTTPSTFKQLVYASRVQPFGRVDLLIARFQTFAAMPFATTSNVVILVSMPVSLITIHYKANMTVYALEKRAKRSAFGERPYLGSLFPAKVGSRIAETRRVKRKGLENQWQIPEKMK